MSSLNINDLYETMYEKNNKRLENFDNILKQIHQRIVSQAKLEQTHCFFQVPEFIFGVPLYNIHDLRKYLINSLEKNGFKIIKMYGQGSNFHKNLYQKNKAGFSIFSVMKLGIHKLLPIKFRSMIKDRVLGDSNDGMTISENNWRNSSVQIALCEIV